MSLNIESRRWSYWPETRGLTGQAAAGIVILFFVPALSAGST